MGFLDSDFQQNFGSRHGAARGCVVVLVLVLGLFWLWRSEKDALVGESIEIGEIVEVRDQTSDGNVYIHVMVHDERIVAFFPTNRNAPQFEASYPKVGMKVDVIVQTYSSGKTNHTIDLKTMKQK